jgi:hypothetical protein
MLEIIFRRRQAGIDLMNIRRRNEISKSRRKQTSNCGNGRRKGARTLKDI